MPSCSFRNRVASCAGVPVPTSVKICDRSWISSFVGAGSKNVEVVLVFSSITFTVIAFVSTAPSLLVNHIRDNTVGSPQA